MVYRVGVGGLDTVEMNGCMTFERIHDGICGVHWGIQYAPAKSRIELAGFGFSFFFFFFFRAGSD